MLISTFSQNQEKIYTTGAEYTGHTCGTLEFCLKINKYGNSGQ